FVNCMIARLVRACISFPFPYIRFTQAGQISTAVCIQERWNYTLGLFPSRYIPPLQRSKSRMLSVVSRRLSRPPGSHRSTRKEPDFTPFSAHAERLHSKHVLSLCWTSCRSAGGHGVHPVLEVY